MKSIFKKKEIKEKKERKIVFPPSFVSIEQQMDKQRKALDSYKNLFRPYQPPEGVLPPNKEIPAPNLLVGDSLPNFGCSPTFANNNALSGLAAFEEGLYFPGYSYLSLLSLRGEYRMIVETRALQMTREWIILKHKKGRNEDKLLKLNIELKKFKVKDVLTKLLINEGYFGLAHLYFKFNNSSDEENTVPLIIDKRKIQKNSLRELVIVSPLYTCVTEYNSSEPLLPNFYKPIRWAIMGKEIHASRLISFSSMPVSNIMKPSFNFGGVSLGYMCKPYVDNWLKTRQFVSDILRSSNFVVLQTDLSALYSQDSPEQLENRLQSFNQIRDSRGIFLCDKEEEDIKNVSLSLSNLDKLQEQSQEQLSFISSIPLVILLGKTASGLNASSDGEIRTYYDKVKANQEKLLRPLLETILKILQLNAFGEIDEDIEFEFNPLWQIDEEERAKITKIISNSLADLVKNKIVAPEEAKNMLYGVENFLFKNLDFKQKEAES